MSQVIEDSWHSAEIRHRTVTLRIGGKRYHIGVGRTHARTRVLLLVQDLDIRIIDAATGELLRQLTLDTSRNYQPTRQPPRTTP
ncbi:MAG TPA: hypothetical protein VGH53_26985 [Streptosporangiaceae bacterium]